MMCNVTHGPTYAKYREALVTRPLPLAVIAVVVISHDHRISDLATLGHKGIATYDGAIDL